MVTGVSEDVVRKADPLVVVVILSLQVPVPNELADVASQADTNVGRFTVHGGTLFSEFLGCTSQL